MQSETKPFNKPNPCVYTPHSKTYLPVLWNIDLIYRPSGRRWSRTTRAKWQQIYSLPRYLLRYILPYIFIHAEGSNPPTLRHRSCTLICHLLYTLNGQNVIEANGATIACQSNTPPKTRTLTNRVGAGCTSNYTKGANKGD